jgi:tricorn protease
VTDGYPRFPHLHQELITFVADDDVWLAPIEGGRAWRVTADQAGATRPRFSQDGATLAWTSWLDVEPEVHAVPVDGGSGRRLTYWGDIRTTVWGWTPQGAVLAVSSTGQASSRRTWAYSVPLDGSPATRLPFGPVGAVSYGPGGAILLGSTTFREPAHWKRYRGGTTGKLWLDAGGTGEFTRILSELDGNISSSMFWAGRIAFLSDHEGVGSLYSCALDGTDLRRHTAQDYYARNASTDGSRVIYHSAGELWLVAGLDEQPRRIDVRLSGPRGGRTSYPLHTSDGLTDVSPDHTGRASAVEVRGTVHWLTHRDGPARALAVQQGVRARLPRVLGTTGSVMWVSDSSGEDALEIMTDDATRQVGAGELGRVLELAASPDGSRAAVITHDGRVLLVDVASGDIREVVRSIERDPWDLAFSPDSAWLAWSHPGPYPLRHIRMARVSDGSIVDVSDLRFQDSDPVFTADGKHLAFLSLRSFDPMYDAHVFDLSFPNGSRPYLVPLAATTPSPFAPSLLGRPVDGSSDESKKDDEEAPVPPTVVDLKGLADRVVPFPVPAARYWGLRAVKDGVLWMRVPIGGVLGDDLAQPGEDRRKTVLERFDLIKRKVHRVADRADDVWPSGDGERILVWDGDDLRVLPADHKADSSDDSDDSDDRITVDLDRVRVLVDPVAEWHQSFDEAGRLMRDHFWRADMGGVDWASTLARYRPLVDSLGSHAELIDLLWEVQGELGTSHAYADPPDSHVDHGRRLGLLGADLSRDSDGVWRIASILPGESSDPRARSPLLAPGVAARVGDGIVAIGGLPISASLGPGPLLIGAAGQPIELTLAPADGGAHRRVVVVPLLDDMPLRYQAWVADRRAHVHAVSEGRVGYLHVPDMVASGWAQLHRDLRLEVRREALIVDVRENSGGHLSQLVVEKLGRTVIGWQIARDNYHAAPYPYDAPRGPIVAVANEWSGSDGDIVNAAIRALGIGPVIGVRTWGGTIGIDMRYRLVDGTLVTQPRYATWIQGPGWGLENHGVDPDIEVVTTPADHAAARDPQLDTAIRVALETLERHPAATPPTLPPL